MPDSSHFTLWPERKTPSQGTISPGSSRAISNCFVESRVASQDDSVVLEPVYDLLCGCISEKTNGGIIIHDRLRHWKMGVISDKFVDANSVIFKSVYDILRVCISKKMNGGICTVRL